MDLTRPIPWETRKDILSYNIEANSVHDDQTTVVIKDPLKNEYYRFEPIEYFILSRLSETVSIQSLIDEVRDRFQTQLSAGEVMQYVSRLAHDNLVFANRFGDGTRLHAQHQRERSALRLQGLLGILSIKLPGFYPATLLTMLRPAGWLFFNSVTVALVAILFMATVAYGLLNFEVVLENMPGLSEFFAFQNVALMTLGFLLAKVLHELGHALACQQTGHRVSEMGILFLVFMPCMYCDASDMWTEKSRWKRIFVSLAGIYVELTLAMICFWLWMSTTPGVFHQFLFGLMMVTSLNTLFVNGNPLMRFDGYYVLSDAVGIPNLAGESKNLLNDKIASLFARQSTPVEYNKAGILLTYAIAALLYRFFILFVIIWAVWTFFESRDLQAFGTTSVLTLSVISVVPMLGSLAKLFQKIKASGFRLTNVAIFLILLSGIAWLLFAFEYPRRIRGQANVELADAAQLFAPDFGQFDPLVADGSMVTSGAEIVRIQNSELDLEQIELEGDRSEVQIRLDSLRKMPDNAELAADIQFWEERLASIDQQLDELNKRIGSLSVRAPRDGQLIGLRSPPVARQSLEISKLSGGVFDSENAGNFVKRGAPLGYVGNAKILRGFVEVDESDIQFVSVDDSVRILDPAGSESFEGRVTRISVEGKKSRKIENPLSNTEANDLPSYFMVEFDFEKPPTFRPGAQYSVLILVDNTTIAQNIARWWNNNVRF